MCVMCVMCVMCGVWCVVGGVWGVWGVRVVVCAVWWGMCAVSAEEGAGGGGR